MKGSFWLFFAATLFCSCSGGTKKSNLPPASGLSGDMYVVMDSLQWKGPVGVTLDSLFTREMDGLPRGEPLFKMKWVDPRKLNFILKQRRNLIFVTTLDQNTTGSRIVKKLFTPGSLEKIKSDPGLYLQTSPNLFAKGQEVMFLFGQTETQLLQNIHKNGHQLIEYFDRTERERLGAALFKSTRMKGVSDWLRSNMQCDIHVPYGYKLAQNETDFLWVRQINPRDDKDVFITQTNYTSQDQFKLEALIRFRDEVCRKYLFEDPDILDSYLVTETEIPFIPVVAKEINFKGRYAVELRGLWRTNNKSMGGPFLGYAMANEANGKFYYVEGFTFSPGKDQREIIRELETIIFSFELLDSPTARK